MGTTTTISSECANRVLGRYFAGLESVDAAQATNVRSAVIKAGRALWSALEGAQGGVGQEAIIPIADEYDISPSTLIEAMGKIGTLVLADELSHADIERCNGLFKPGETPNSNNLTDEQRATIDAGMRAFTSAYMLEKGFEFFMQMTQLCSLTGTSPTRPMGEAFAVLAKLGAQACLLYTGDVFPVITQIEHKPDPELEHMAHHIACAPNSQFYKA